MRTASACGRASGPVLVSVPAPAPASVIASGVQGGHAIPHDTVIVASIVLAMVAAAVVIAAYLRRRSRRPAPVADEWRAQAVMGELCPDGWQAQITLYGWGAPVPADAPASRAPLVELEWRRFDADPTRSVSSRRCWSPSIREALQTMVDSRRADLELEQIEQHVLGEDDPDWSS